MGAGVQEWCHKSLGKPRFAPLRWGDGMADAERQIEPPRLAVEMGPRRLTFRLHQQTGDGGESDSSGKGDWLIVMREISDDAVVEAMNLDPVLPLVPRIFASRIPC